MSTPVNIDSFFKKLEELQVKSYNSYIAAKQAGQSVNEMYFRGEWNGLKIAKDAASIYLFPPQSADPRQSMAAAQPGETPRPSGIRVRDAFGSKEEIERENQQGVQQSASTARPKRKR